MRRLHRLGQHVAARHREILALEAGIRLHDHHVGDLLRSLQRHGAFFLGGDAETAELEPRGAFADAEIDPAVGDDVERGETFGSTRGVIVVGDHLADAVAEANGFGARRCGSQKDLGRRRMRIFFEEVMFDLPGVVEAEPVRQFDLRKRLMKEITLVAFVPGPRQLEFVEHLKLFALFPSS